MNILSVSLHLAKHVQFAKFSWQSGRWWKLIHTTTTFTANDSSSLRKDMWMKQVLHVKQYTGNRTKELCVKQNKANRKKKIINDNGLRLLCVSFSFEASTQNESNKEMKGIRSTNNNWGLRRLAMREYGYSSDANEGKKDPKWTKCRSFTKIKYQHEINNEETIHIQFWCQHQTSN